MYLIVFWDKKFYICVLNTLLLLISNFFLVLVIACFQYSTSARFRLSGCSKIILKWRCIRLREISCFNNRADYVVHDRDVVCNIQTLVLDSHPPQVAADEGGKGLCMEEEKIKYYMNAFVFLSKVFTI